MSAERISLEGTWRFRLDPREEGEKNSWQKLPMDFPLEIRVPGSWQSQGIGNATRADARRTPATYESFFPEMDPTLPASRAEYSGMGWYGTSFTVPSTWKGKQIWLVFEGIHPASRFWIDGDLAGEHRRGPLEPCRLNITHRVRFDREQSLVVCVTEDLRLLQGVVKWPYFSGIHKSVYLEATGLVWIENVWVNGEVSTGAAKVSVEIGSSVKPARLRLLVDIQDRDGKRDSGSGEFAGNAGTAILQVAEHRLWSPEDPFLYMCSVQVSGDGMEAARGEVRFGFRELKRDGRRILLNGQPLFLRGTGFAGPMGLPGPEPAPANYYQRLVRRIKEYGFNYLRWHTYACEPALLDAADEQGLLVQSELFSNLFETETERRLTEEQCVLMVRRNRNHPCVAIWAMGNEHDGPEPLFREFRDRLCRIARDSGPGPLVMDSDGVADNNLAGHDESDVIAAYLGVGVGDALDVAAAAAEKVRKRDKPYFIHEFGYPESFPEVKDIPLYAGGIRPFWLEHTLRSARNAGMEQLLPDFVRNSRRLQLLVHRKAIEDVRRVDELAGYLNWGFHDFLHESTGLVDLFFRDKSMSASEFLRCNGERVLLCEPLLDRYTLTGGQALPFRLFCSNHSNKPLDSASIEWRLMWGERCLDQGVMTASVKPFGTTVLGERAARTETIGKPCAVSLEARIAGTDVKNDWRFWLFPDIPSRPLPLPVHVFKDPWPTMTRIRELYPDISPVTEAGLWDLPGNGLLLTPLVTHSVSSYLRRGGRVLLTPIYYLSTASGMPMQSSSFGGFPSFAGLRGGQGTIVTGHPALGDFPHDGWCDYQWFDLIAGERVPHLCVPFHHRTPGVYDLSCWPVKIEPIVRSIPLWKNCENRAYLFEVCVGKGRLLATTMRILEIAATRPEGRYLFDTLVRYATSADFRPAAAVTARQFDALRFPAAFINQ